MNSVPEINRDLTHWSGKKWAGLIALIFAGQLAVLFAGSRPLAPRTVYPEEPGIAMQSGPFPHEMRQWLRLDNPQLFAAATREGFSGRAWLVKNRMPSFDQNLDEPAYLGFRGSEPAEGVLDDAPFDHTRLLELDPPPAGEAGAPREITGESRVFAEGFSGLRYAGNLKPPVQYYNDAVGSSVVEAVVEADGMLVSATLAASSGSKAADADALNLARQARFLPQRAELERRRPRMVTGKLIFEWFALDSSRTNNMKR